jgi:opacity protein-like surface antigen
MKKSIGVLFLVFLISCIASAQDIPKVEVFGGYAIQRLGYSEEQAEGLEDIFNNLGLSGNFETKRFLNKGWIGSVTYNLTDMLGIEADFRRHSGDILDGSFDVQGIRGRVGAEYSNFAFLAGPRIAFRQNEAVTPFAHALFGIDRGEISARASALGFSDSQDVDSDVGFGLALGGGLDWNVSRNFAVRFIQADYYMTKNWSETMNNLALAFGIVIRFGD